MRKRLEFSYPLDYTLYNTEEITTIIEFLDTVEKCYFEGVDNDEYAAIYKKFKTVVRAKSEENNIYKQFKEVTDYDGYQTTKLMKEKGLRLSYKTYLRLLCYTYITSISLNTTVPVSIKTISSSAKKLGLLLSSPITIESCGFTFHSFGTKSFTSANCVDILT